MASLFDLIGPGVTEWRDKNKNALLGVGTSLLSSGMDFSGVQRGAALDQELQERRKAEERKAAEQQALRGWLAKSKPELAPLLDAGIDGNTLVSQALQPPPGPDYSNLREINGQLVDMGTGQVVGDYRTPEGPGGADAPALVQEYEYAKSQGFEGSLIDYQQAKGRNSGTPPATIAKEIFEADEGAQAGQNVISALDRALELNKTAGDGPLADTWSAGAALFGDQQAVQTQELKNIVTANALESLKATFGAAPTEGERKILLEIQGSVNQSRPVREAIFKRAKAAAERRLKFNQERGGALRGGNYFDPGYSPVGAPPAGNVDDILGKYGL